MHVLASATQSRLAGYRRPGAIPHCCCYPSPAKLRHPLPASVPPSRPGSSSCRQTPRQGHRLRPVAAAELSSSGSVFQALKSVTNSKYDKEIWQLALPALVAMLLEPIMSVINAGPQPPEGGGGWGVIAPGGRQRLQPLGGLADARRSPLLTDKRPR